MRAREKKKEGEPAAFLSLSLSRPLQHHGSQCATLETGSADSLHPPPA